MATALCTARMVPSKAVAVVTRRRAAGSFDNFSNAPERTRAGGPGISRRTQSQSIAWNSRVGTVRSLAGARAVDSPMVLPETAGMPLQVLDPTNETTPPLGQPALRAASLAGKTVGFISNGKEGTLGFFNHLERILRDQYGVAEVIRRTKSNYSAPADPDIVDELRRWQAVVTGIGD